MLCRRQRQNICGAWVFFLLAAFAIAPGRSVRGADGSIVAWGWNQYGQTNVPAGTFTAIAGGAEFSLAIRSDGTLAGWGGGGDGQATPPAGTFTAVAAGAHHGLAIRSDGTLVGWGWNAYGQINVPAGTFTAVAGGGYHSLAIRSDGTLVGWGRSGEGQINVPTGTFAAIDAGHVHSLAIRSDGTMAGWGCGVEDFGQCNVPSGTFIAVAAGWHHNLAIRSDGTLVGWGDNGFGQTNVPSGTFVGVAAGDGFSLAIRTNGTLVGWGRNDFGQTEVPSGTFIAVGSGGYHGLAIGGDCGNGVCDPGETPCNCPADCGPASCGDSTCCPGEDSCNCPSDCSGSCCGNGLCEGGENSCNCPSDCGGAFCGDGTCCPGENSCTCQADCPGACCGNNVQEGSEQCDGNDAAACPGQCRADCTCPPPPPAACGPGQGDCCVGHANPGCQDVSCCQRVCAADPFCCDVVWYQFCADEALQICGCDGCSIVPVCGNGTVDCGEQCDPPDGATCDAMCQLVACGPGQGDCCVGHANPGCQDVSCCGAVCAADPFCCDVEWDQICADEAVNIFCEPAVCKPRVCGDGIIQLGEQCDPPDGVTCDGNCQLTTICDPGKPPENEPNCGLPTDTVNGGCNSTPPVFTPIACGDTFCGTGAFNGATRDTDWYKLVLGVPTTVTWTITAHFQALVGILETGGVDACPVSSFRVFTVLPFGTTGSVSDSLPAGTWYLFVAPDFAGLVTCGAEYNATLTCGPPPGCPPMPDKKSCTNNTCPNSGERCAPKRIQCFPPPDARGCEVVECSCDTVDDCHVEMPPPGATEPVCQAWSWSCSIAASGGNSCDLETVPLPLPGGGTEYSCACIAPVRTNVIVWDPTKSCNAGVNINKACATDADCPPGTSGICVAWPNVNPKATTRSLRFKVTGSAGPYSKPEAIKVTMVDLQHPRPPNLPAQPPPNLTAYDTRLNGVCVGGTLAGHHCDTNADCTGGGTCSSLVACTADPACTTPLTCTPPSNNCARWVGKPGTFLEAQDSPGAGNYRAARLQCTPFYWDWKPEGLITVVGADIAPSSEYSAQVYGEPCWGAETGCIFVSVPVTMYTRRSGDAGPNFNPPATSTQPDALDVAAVVNKLKNLSGALVKAITQLQPNVPELNADINALDIVAVVDGVKGVKYAFSGPCPCPSAVPCGGACGTGCPAPNMCVKTCVAGTNAGDPCINNTHCPGSTCSTTGSCRDRCGRCRP